MKYSDNNVNAVVVLLIHKNIGISTNLKPRNPAIVLHILNKATGNACLNNWVVIFGSSIRWKCYINKTIM